MVINVKGIAAVALLSAATLGFEVLLMRMFSIAQWHHFAYMIISLALLGYGASGTFLCFTRARLLRRFSLAFAGFAIFFGLTAPAAFSVASHIPLNVLEIAWDVNQHLHLLLVYTVLAVPFFCAATAIGLALAAAGNRVSQVYRSDLIGAGVGALAIVGGLFVLRPEDCLKAIGSLGMVAAVIAGLPARLPKAASLGLFAIAALLPWAWPDGWLTPEPSPYKQLSLSLSAPNATVMSEHSSPLGTLTVVRSPTIPFRYAPGLSLNATIEPPEQLGVFTDGDAMTPITRFDGRLETIAYLDQQTGALAYHLLDRPRVLILGAGGGADVLLARFHDARTIDAVEINPQMVRLVQHDFAEFAGGVFNLPPVSIHVSEARSFVAGSRKTYDLIQIALLDSFSAAAAGLHALNESTLYTVEAMATYLDKLSPGGLLSVTRWLKVPPRDSLKLFATAVAALERRGVEDPSRRIAAIRGWRTTTLLVKNGVLTGEEIQAIRRFSDRLGFDLAYLPGLEATQANRNNILDRPYLFEGTGALLGPHKDRFLADYRFDIAPSTDDRPYFFHFLKWRTLLELLEQRDRGGLNLIEWGYPVILATLAQAIVVGAALILLPLIALRGSRLDTEQTPRHHPRLAVAFYFFALGLAFLFMEMAFIQKFQLFLGHPLYAVSVVLCGFLVFAGLGGGFSQRWSRHLGGQAGKAVATAAGAIVLLALIYLWALPPVFEHLGAWPSPAKIAAAIMLICPIAFLMGIPFPLGLAETSVHAPELVPWAWGINGCASVISAVLATVLAIHIGFSGVVLLATAIYGAAAISFPRYGRSQNRADVIR